jgi:addiction module HigA family antidote
MSIRTVRGRDTEAIFSGRRIPRFANIESVAMRKLALLHRITLKLSTTTRGIWAMREVSYPTPGEILLEEFLKPMGLTQYRLAKEIGVPQRRIGEIISGKRSITTDTGLRLSRFFGMNDAFWVGLQLDHDLAETGAAMREVLENIHPVSRPTGPGPRSPTDRFRIGAHR